MYVEEFTALLDSFARDLDTKPLDATLEACHTVVVEGHKEHFVFEQGPDGRAWAPRKDQGFTHSLLNLSGALMAAATGGAGHVKRIENGRELTTGVEKQESGSLAGARVHQFGATIRPVRARYLSWLASDGKRVFAKQVTVPPRPYVGASDTTIERLNRTIAAGVMQEVFGQ